MKFDRLVHKLLIEQSTLPFKVFSIIMDDGQVKLRQTSTYLFPSNTMEESMMQFLAKENGMDSQECEIEVRWLRYNNKNTLAVMPYYNIDIGFGNIDFVISPNHPHYKSIERIVHMNKFQDIFSIEAQNRFGSLYSLSDPQYIDSAINTCANIIVSADTMSDMFDGEFMNEIT